MENNLDPRGFGDVGVRLREMRQSRNLSMRALARASGLSTNALSMIERGLTSPSVSTLYKLADALEIPVTSFFRQVQPRRSVIFTESSTRQAAPFSAGFFEDLGGLAFDGRVEPFMLILDPGATSGDYDITHTGHEFVICLEGQIEYEVDEQLYLLNPFDTLLFSSHLRHSWRNPGMDKAKVAIILSGFEKQERPSEFHIARSQGT